LPKEVQALGGVSRGRPPCEEDVFADAKGLGERGQSGPVALLGGGRLELGGLPSDELEHGIVVGDRRRVLSHGGELLPQLEGQRLVLQNGRRRLGRVVVVFLPGAFGRVREGRGRRWLGASGFGHGGAPRATG